MWIKEVIIEGFKPYVTRTIFPHFDPEFNVITGFGTDKDSPGAIYIYDTAG